MKKITLLFALLMACWSWHANAQFGCETAIPITDGYTASGITTPGTGGAEDWNDNPADTSINAGYWDDDVYLFQYTAGATAEEISMSIFSRNSWNGIGIFDDCTGNSFSNELDAMGNTESNSAKTVSAVIAAGNTVYIAIGQWGTPNALDFDVTEFSVTALTCPAPFDIVTNNITASSAEISWTPFGEEVAWQVVVQEAGTGEPIDAGLAVDATTFLAENLNAGTDHEIYVRADCGNDDYSTWVGPVDFATEPSCYAPEGLMASNITSSSADLGWTAGDSNETAWNIEIVEAGEAVTGSGTATTQNPFTATSTTAGGNFAPNTSYEFYVQADCGEGDFSAWVGPFEFTTACNEFGDFTENFDDTPVYEIPDCWNSIVSSSSSAPYIETRTTSAYSDPNGLRMGNSSDADAELYFISPALTDLINQTHQIRFVAAGNGDLEIGTMSNPTDETTYTTVEVLDLSSNFQEFMVNFDASTTDSHVVFKATYTSTYNTVSIDDVIWQPIPSCPETSDLVASNITSTTVDFSWTAGGSETVWNIEVVLSGEEPTGVPTFSGVTNPFTAAELLPATEYEFYVQADCGNDDYSAWEGPLAFTTTCEAVDEFPSYTDFTLNPPSICWSEAGSGEIVDGPSDMGGSDWRANRAYENVYGLTVNSNALNLFSDSDREWLISPVYELPAAVPHRLLVEVAVTDYDFSGTTTATDAMGSDDEVKLLMTSDNGATWTELTTWSVNNQPSVNGTMFIEDLSSITGNVQFAIWGSDGTENDSEDYDFHIGKFTIEAVPSCEVPSGLTADNYTVNSVDLAWTAGGSETLWNIEIVTEGAEPTGTPTATGVGNPYTATDLNFVFNSYEYYVQADCGEGDVSNWVGPFILSPFCESEPSSVDNDGITNIELQETEFLVEVEDVTYHAFLDNAVDVQQGVDTNLQITFATGYTYGTNIWIDFNDNFEFESGELVFEGESTNANPTTFDASFSLPLDAALGVHRMRIATADGGQADPDPCYSGTYGVTVDLAVNVTEAPPCIAPEDLTVTNIFDTVVDVSWSAGGNESEWLIIYGEEGFDPATSGTTVEDTDGIIGETISGLQAETHYEFYVMSICGVDQSEWVGPFAFETASQGECGHNQISNNIENGSFMEAGGQMVANDFIVSANTINFALNEVTLNVLSQGGLSTVDLIFFEDDNGMPGTEIISVTDITPTSQDIIGNAFGYDLYEVSIELASTLDFAGDGQNEMRYWMQVVGYPTVEGTQVAWETTTSNQIGESLYFDNEDTTEWTLDDADGVFELDGECTLVECPYPGNILITQLTPNSVEFGWNTVAAAVEYEYILVFEGLDPETATPIHSGTTADSQLILETLDSNTGYDFYLRTNCSDAATSTWDMVNFATPMGCGDIFTDTGGVDANYSNSENLTWTFAPEDPSQFVQLDFSFVDLEANYDFLRVYDGPDATYPEISGEDGVEEPGMYTASTPGQPLTVVFTSDGIVTNPGWEAEVICTTCLAPQQIGISDITANTATATWNAVDGAMEYNYILIFAGLDPETATPIYSGTISDLTTTFTGLEAGTEYEIYVQTSCTDEDSNWNSQEFLTSYGCGSDFFDTGGIDGNYANNEDETWTISPENPDEFVQIDFSFVNVEAGYDELRIYDGPDTSYPELSDPDDGILEPGVYTSSVPGQTITITFSSDGSVSRPGWEATIACLTCIAPLNIDIENLTSSSATITWSEFPDAIGYDYLVVFEGLDPETATPVAQGTTPDAFADIDLLDAATEYDVYVRTQCEVDDVSPWSQPFTFLTYCDPVTEFVENFDEVATPELPVCWDKLLSDGVSDFATVRTVASNNYSAPNGVEMYNSSSPATSNIMLISPWVSNLDAGTHWFRFYARNTNAAQDLEVGTISDPEDASTFTPFELVDIDGEWRQYIVDFTSYTGTDEFIAVRRLSSSTYTYVYFDNAIWEEKPECVWPLDVQITETTVEGGTATWQEVSNASEYTWIAVEEGADPENAANILATGTSTTNQADITGLSSGTSYDFYVMADCDAGGFSNWSDVVTFTTNYDCGDVFYDTGGPNGNYSGNENETWTIYPNDPSEYVQINFTMVNTENGWDDLRVYDGPDNTYPELSEPGNGVSSPGIYTSSSAGGALTVTFTSDGIVNYSGWEAIIECVTCVAPTNIQVDELFAEGANISWDPFVDALDGYEWVVVLEGGDPENAADIQASGSTMDDFANIEGLMSSTDYEFYILTNCGEENGYSSYAAGVPFTTLCQAPTGLAVTGVGSDEVTFTWDPVMESLGYEFIIVESGGDPTVEDEIVGIGVIGSPDQSSITVGYLEADVEYDLYLRIVCDTNFYGQWGTVPFQTTLGINQELPEGFTYYPNPISQQNGYILNLGARSNIEMVTIFNMLGQEIKTERPNLLSHQLDMSNLQTGPYIIKVTVGGETGTFKVIKD